MVIQMGLSLKYLIYDAETDKLKIIPSSKFEKLFNREQALNEFAGEQIKYISVVVQLENRKPVSIRALRFHLMQIDQDGKFDIDFLNELNQAAAQLISLPIDLPNNVIDRSADFAQKKFKQQFTWSPSSAIENRVRKIILGR